MGVRDTDVGRRPIAKSVEFSKVSSREGLHLLGQSLRFFFPLFAALFGFLPPSGRLRLPFLRVLASSAVCLSAGI